PARQAAGEQRGGQRVEVGGARERRVDGFELPGRLEQQRRCVAAAPRRERDLTTQQLHARRLEVTGVAFLGGGEQSESLVERARLVRRLRRRKRPLGAAPRLRCERYGALQEGGGRDHTTPRLRPSGRAPQFEGDVLVR